ncbi:hypothetical protein Q3V30_22160 (plasmid) [Erwinia pyri]|uniref:Uncharacterized protein n=1 Tax=Erwinia pyri TaxID=3062598 RepID=A0AA50DQ97_9GAMM|nr:hypothetical protein [Erwinia sp. DE2]WLS81163.1 hypothetical protein Q3V30_22160 [Erwinia sp. DE2]
MESEKYFQGYSGRLGDYLFPEEGFYDMEARHCVSELLARHGGASTPQAFLVLLETFTPEMVQHKIDNPDWSTAQTVSRWENTTKKLIRRRTEQRFADELAAANSSGQE